MLQMNCVSTDISVEGKQRTRRKPNCPTLLPYGHLTCWLDEQGFHLLCNKS